MSVMQSLSVCDNVQHFMSIRACVGVRPGQKNEVYFVGLLSTFLDFKIIYGVQPWWSPVDKCFSYCYSDQKNRRNGIESVAPWAKRSLKSELINQLQRFFFN